MRRAYVSAPSVSVSATARHAADRA